MCRSCAARDEPREVVERAVARVDVQVVGDVVAVVAQRRGKEGQQPEAGDAEALQVVELLREALKVADAVVVAVEERLDVRLVDDRVLVPERIVVRARSAGRRDRVDGHGQMRSVDRHVHLAPQRRLSNFRCAPAGRPDRTARSSSRRARCTSRRSSRSCDGDVRVRVRRRRHSTKPCCMWCGSRLTIMSSRSESSGARFAVRDDLGVVGGREIAAVQSNWSARVLAADRVHARDELVDVAGLVPSPSAGSGTSPSRRTPRCPANRAAFAQLEAAVDAVARAERRREHEPRLERRPTAVLQVRVQDVGRVREQVRPEILAHVGRRRAR